MSVMKTVMQTIEEVVGKMCNEYCKFPEEYISKYSDEDERDDKLYTDRCENCPLNKLI